MHGVHPFLTARPPVAIAHRGGAGAAPENTASAFARAVALGYGYLETDAHVTLDGVLVAFHDARLDRVTDRSGAIAELSVDDVQAADAGFAFTPDGGHTFPFRGRDVRVPQIDELLRRWPQARWIIDPKSDACVAPLARLLDRLDAWSRVCVGSFSDTRLRTIRALGRGRACTSMGPREVTRARLLSTFGAPPPAGPDCVQVPLRHRGVPIATPHFVRAAHRRGLPVHVWTINDEPTMHRLLDLGVDGIMTDRLELLRDVLESRGVGLGRR
jgi:glycerophosphoryl diester phosphodiesterase